MEFYDFHFIYGNVIIPTDELHHIFRGAETTNQLLVGDGTCIGREMKK